MSFLNNPGEPFRSLGMSNQNDDGGSTPQVIDIGLRAASLIGTGLYGVDIKETQDGFFVVEVNDNPNIEHGVEDFSEKDQVWVELTKWFIDRLEV